MRFKYPFSIPPGRRWFYQVPNGPFLEGAEGMDRFVADVHGYYSGQGLQAPEDLRGLIEQYMCENLPDGFCTGASSSTPLSPVSVAAGTRLIVHPAYATGHFGRVRADRIDERAKACLSCPKHGVSLCVACHGLIAEFDDFMLGRRTAYDKTLRVCTATMSVLPVVLFADACAMPKDAEYPPECWVVKETKL